MANRTVTRMSHPRSVNSRIGEAHGLAKLNDHAVLEMRRLRKQGYLIAYLAQRFCVSKSTVSGVVRRSTWTHLEEK